MSFHQAAFDLFGEPPRDVGRALAAVNQAAALGYTLPPAVAAWYAVSKDSYLWHAYAGEHAVADWRPGAGESSNYYSNGFGCNRQWHINPVVKHDPAGWVLRPILPLMTENQGCWTWGVVLDGSADPPAVITSDHFPGPWDNCAGRFSTYVYGIVFDAMLRRPGVREAFSLSKGVSAAERAAVRAAFRVEPMTRGSECDSDRFSERFSAPGQRFLFACSWDNAHTHWKMWSADAVAFADLTDRLDSIFPQFARSVHHVEIPF